MGSIATFYSFKGGVGRTMALANIAVLLARKGLRILAVDWDLEAPGLDRYYRTLNIRPAKDGVGLIDLLVDASQAVNSNSKPDWRKYLSYVDIDGKYRLHLLTSGRQDEEYPGKVLNFDWNTFFKQGDGGNFIESLHEQWHDEFDVVLIDSRTGITDSGGVCTIQLPDILVPVFTTNEQSLDGAKRIALLAQKARQKLAFDRMPLLIFPLPSHFDGRTQYEEAREWLKTFATELAPFYNDWLPSRFTPLQILERTKLPYIAYFSFGEKLPVMTEGVSDPESLGYAYQVAATLIGNGFKDAERIITGDPIITESPSTKLSSRSTTLSKPTIFICYSHKDEDWKNRLVTHLGVLRAQGLINIWEDRQIEAGADWYKNIQEAMSGASAAVLLISANSLTSSYILNKDMPTLIERSAKEGVRIFPLVVEPCAWQAVKWLRAMNLRPTDGRPLSDGNDKQIDKDLAALTSEIYLLTQSVAQLPSKQAVISLDPDAISTSRLPVTGRELFGRALELDMLDGAWADSNTTVLSLIAWGGVGKSALVNHWLRSMARDNYRGAEKVYAWSFNRQGTSEQGVSADQFIDAALRWFGDADPTEGSPWDKGERLARLIKNQRTLLLLDGLEPLQYAPGRGQQEGALKDQSMQALLRELAALNPGLCIISSRLPVADLGDYEGDTARRINLEHLSPHAGAEVLKAQGVVGEQAELEQAASEFGGHALAMMLLGSYLKNVYGGDISQRAKVDILKEDEERGGNAQRVMASYERWFKEGPELAVLRMLGLFDRPADGQTLAALRTSPGIAGLTDTIQHLSDEDWQRTLVRLRSAKLIADEDPEQPDTLDAHPLVREYFKQQLKRHSPEAWREGNNRLYEHLKRTTKKFPDTLEEMAPLYAAVAHGCEAGRHQEALVNVYYSKILRRGEAFSINKLGAFGADLAALTNFFDPPWQQPVPTLTDSFKAFVLHQAGFRLRALGRLTEAVQPLMASLKAHLSLEDFKSAAAAAGNLGELYLAIGNLQQALGYAEESVKLADKSGDGFQRVVSITTLADALHQAGRLSDAEADFHKAEQMQNELQPEYPLLYSVQGFQYCDLLLEEGKYEEVQRRGIQTIQWARQYTGSLLDMALDNLSLGRAYMLQAQEGRAGDYLHATDYLNQAVDGLRLAGQLNYLPRGLLSRAELHILKRDFSRAGTDLDEALKIALRGKMELHQADCHLGYTRLYIAQGEQERARKSWVKAKEMIERMGYHRRDKDVQETEVMLSETEI